MNTYKEVWELIKEIESLLGSIKREDGFRLYVKLNESTISLGDESATYNCIFEERGDFDEAYEIYESTSKLIDNIVKAFFATDEQKLYYTLLHDSGLMLMYISKDNDLFYIQNSDNHLHIHYHMSGQY